MRPRLLDLFCGAGGCTKGYQRAGFEVVGVDDVPQPNYCGDGFLRSDALAIAETLLMRVRRGEPAANGLIGRFDAIHASPPCQAYSALRVMPNAGDHPELIEPTRDLLHAIGLPYVIENVVGAPLEQPFLLCGASFGLGTSIGHDLIRHRLFETNWPVGLVPPCAHGGRKGIGIYGDHAKDDRRARSIGNGQFSRPDSLHYGSEAMGIDWMTWKELRQAIPPAYTEFIGHQLMQHLRAAAA